MIKALHTIQNRMSRRTFEKTDLTKTEIKKINVYIDEINEKSQLSISFLDDGSDAFSNLSKSYGIFSNVKFLVLMKGKKTDIDIKEKAGYFGEELILKLTNLELDTCWVGGTFEKGKIKLEDSEELICVIIVGKVKKTSIKEKLTRNAISKKRKSSDQRLITNTNNLPQ